MKPSLLAVFACVIHFAAWADSQMTVDLSARETHIGQTNETKTQGRIRVGFVVDARGVVEIVGILDSGNYNTPWATIASDKPFKDQVPLAFKNIYLRKTIDHFQLEAGALPGEYEIGSAGTGSSGWTDGVQVKVDATFGELRVIAGSLGQFNNANVFERQFSPNFIEVEMTKQIFDALITKTAIQDYNGNFYVKENLEYDLKVIGDRVFKLIANALFDVQHQAVNFEVGAEFDVLKGILGRYDHRLEMKVYFVDVNSHIPDRSKMIPLFLCYGPQGVIYLSGKIDAKGTVSWFVRGSIGSEGRVDAGLSVKLPQITDAIHAD